MFFTSVSRDTGTSISRTRTVSRAQPTPVKLRKLLEGVSLWLLVALFLSLHPVYAEATERGEETAGALYFGEPGSRGEQATLLSADYQVTVSGLIAETRLRQSFSNAGQNWREAIYVFPLPEQASVYSLKMRAGERVIEGEIQTRQEAATQYETAKAESRQAATVAQERPNLFTTRLANIPPGEEITVEIRYQQAVRYQSGEFELRLPTTLTPRYMPGAPQVADAPDNWRQGWAMPTTQVADADAISPFTVLPDDLPPGSHQASISLELYTGLPIASVLSPSHSLQSTWDGDTVRVTPTEGAVPMNRDMIVRWLPVRGEAPSAAVFHERWQGEDYLLALLVPGVERGGRLARELVFVIDTSGSMAGESIRQAQAALMRGLDTLGPDDTFNIIQFSHSARSLFPSAHPASAPNLNQAQAYVRGLTADGGTEMAPALARALAAGKERSGRVRQVVFITDGAVGNEAALFQQIEQELGESRLFTVGIGAAPNLHFMREAARFGRGTYTAITDLTTMAKPLEDLFGKMQAPVLTDLSVAWPDDIQSEALPQRPGDLFLGEPLIQVVRGQAAEGKLVMSGRLAGGQNWQQSLDLTSAAPGQGLHRYWARQKINGLLDRSVVTKAAGESPSGTRTEDQVTELGLKYQLVTPYTSFVAVDKTPRREADEPLDAEPVPTLLPKGSAPAMLRYPQTATGAPALMMTGALGGLLCGLLALVRRRTRT
ncbi:marine proteobacterial sortase target protein [Marinobacter salicampi]|uniref:marine proteobacterial sortase target protein n=1 Tax=Marinobacter salicampi TaxID=435907 RepID=UPI00140D28DD|nr:marine proteobacterial sortase target protein [Marinobacter salicampi]